MSESLPVPSTSHPTPLFRDAAVERQRRRLQGELVLAQPLSTRLLTLSLLAMLAALVTWAANASHVRRATVPGYLQPDAGAVQVYPEHGGRIVAIHVAEGEHVAAGAPLLRLRRGSHLPGHGAIVPALAAEVAQQQRRVAARLAGVDESLSVRRAQLALTEADARARLVSVGARAAGLRRLLASVAAERAQLERAAASISAARLRSARERELEMEQRVYLLDQQLEAARTELDGAALERRRVQLEAGDRRAALEQEMAALRAEALRIEASRDEQLVAPVAGVVSGLQGAVGELLEPGTPALTLLAGGGMQAVLLVPARDAGFVHEGQHVRLRYAAFPHQRFGSWPGTVIRVERSVRLPSELRAAVAVREPVYRVLVAVRDASISAYGQRLALTAGMALEADVELDRRALLGWLFDPLLALAGRL